MEPAFVWTLIALLTVISYASRASFILLLSNVTLSRRIQQGLRFVPASVFTALAVPDIFVRSGTIELGLSNPRAAAAMVAALVAWKTRNTLLTILLGMAVVHLLRLAVLG
ncbi:MAG: AzlD domain-containing protein [Proteobacteria bacterium]|nr:AzlD domain-containing protein [Pseudomonadota bacterium]